MTTQTRAEAITTLVEAAEQSTDDAGYALAVAVRAYRAAPKLTREQVYQLVRDTLASSESYLDYSTEIFFANVITDALLPLLEATGAISKEHNDG